MLKIFQFVWLFQTILRELIRLWGRFYWLLWCVLFVKVLDCVMESYESLTHLLNK